MLSSIVKKIKDFQEVKQILCLIQFPKHVMSDEYPLIL